MHIANAKPISAILTVTSSLKKAVRAQSAVFPPYHPLEWYADSAFLITHNTKRFVLPTKLLSFV